METRIDDAGLPPAVSATVVSSVVDSAGAAIPGLADVLVANEVDPATAQSVQEASGEAFTDGAQSAAFFAAGFLVLGLLSTFRLRARPSLSRTTEESTQG